MFYLYLHSDLFTFIGIEEPNAKDVPLLGFIQHERRLKLQGQDTL